MEDFVTSFEGAPLAKPNDLAFDSAGNLIFTCPGNSVSEPEGYVCCLRPDRKVRSVADGLYFPNGLLFADGDSRLIVAETHRQRLWSGTWEPGTCRWSAPQPWADLEYSVGPDGMALAEDGRVVAAHFGQGRLVVVAPDGSTVAEVRLPGNRPTNCAFDPTGRLGLVVTEAEKGLLLSIPGFGPGAPLFTGSEQWP